jgi:hypothetical protein
MDGIVCRCGKEMEPLYDSDPMEDSDFYARFVCKCGWMAPWGKMKHTKDEARMSAFDAATRRPPNLLLTKKQVMEMDDLDAVWIVRQSYERILCTAGTLKYRIDFEPSTTGQELWFAANPTTADIEAARKEIC